MPINYRKAKENWSVNLVSRDPKLASQGDVQFRSRAARGA